MGQLFSQPAGDGQPPVLAGVGAGVVQCVTACTGLPVKAHLHVHTLPRDASKALSSIAKSDLVIVDALSDLMVHSKDASSFYVLLGVVAFGKPVISRDSFAKKARPEVGKHAHRHKRMIGNPVHFRVAEDFAKASQSYVEALKYCSRVAHTKWTVEVVQRLGPVARSASAKSKACAKAKASAKTCAVVGEIFSVSEAFRFVKGLHRFEQNNMFRLVQLGK